MNGHDNKQDSAVHESEGAIKFIINNSKIHCIKTQRRFNSSIDKIISTEKEQTNQSFLLPRIHQPTHHNKHSSALQLTRTIGDSLINQSQTNIHSKMIINKMRNVHKKQRKEIKKYKSKRIIKG